MLQGPYCLRVWVRMLMLSRSFFHQPPSSMGIATFQPCCLWIESSSCNLLFMYVVGFFTSHCEKRNNRANLVLALNGLFLQAEAPYRRNFHADRALTDKHTVYYNVQITITNECTVLIPCFHTLNFIFTFSTIFLYLSHHFCQFPSSYTGKNLLE